MNICGNNFMFSLNLVIVLNSISISHLMDVQITLMCFAF